MTIFGLGNPGLKYRSTRHNAGFIFLDQLVRRSRKRYSRGRFYDRAFIRIRGEEIHCVKPKSWMNESGIAIAAILGSEDRDILIILDDINLPLGKMRLRPKGSDGGHLGLRSIIDALGTDDFPRLRIGIGQSSMDAAAYVLGRFSAAEKKVLKSVIDHGIKGIRMLVCDGFEKAQNYINSIKIELDSTD